MNRLIVIVEGDTEKHFVDTTFSAFLHSKGFYDIHCFKIKHSKGGLSKYEHLRKDILNCVYEPNTLVTTLIDFYALPRDFPGYTEAELLSTKDKKLKFLETSIREELESTQKRVFNHLKPYIQLHEFEALVFSSFEAIESLYAPHEANFKEIEKIMRKHSTPEDINDNPNTAPSKRLLKHIYGYNKFVDGILIIEEAGLGPIRKKCPRFNSWVEMILKELSI